jgi:integral membrane sensor domain MASE1
LEEKVSDPTKILVMGLIIGLILGGIIGFLFLSRLPDSLRTRSRRARKPLSTKI